MCACVRVCVCNSTYSLSLLLTHTHTRTLRNEQCLHSLTSFLYQSIHPESKENLYITEVQAMEIMTVINDIQCWLKKITRPAFALG